MNLKICALALALLPLTLAVACDKKAEPVVEEVKPAETTPESAEATTPEGGEVKTEGAEVKTEEK
ncbi:MAG: hypothetical protein LBH03_01170 [Holophagales bacterium]|jgi:hypothetical protein|nr:hypothetical protein [Holophagales bacterium]